MLNINNKFRRGYGEILTYIYPWLKNLKVPDNKFIIFAQARTGSILLGDLLNSHPEIFCDDEILLNGNPLFPNQYIKSRAAIKGKNVYGYQLKVDQLIFRQHTDPPRFMFNLQNDGWKIVYLRRRNLLRQAISELIAYSRNQWHDRTENSLGNLKIHIDCDRLIGIIKFRESMLCNEAKALEKLSYLPIIYEDDLLQLEKHQETLDRIFNYLGLRSVPVKTQYYRTTSDHISDFIQNYEEIINVVNKTEYAKFLKS